MGNLESIKVYLQYFNWKCVPLLMILFALKNILSIKASHHVSGNSSKSFFFSGLLLVPAEGAYMFVAEFALSWLQFDVGKRIHYETMIRSFERKTNDINNDNDNKNNTHNLSTCRKIFHLFSKHIKRVENFSAFKKSTSELFSVVTSIFFFCGLSITHAKCGINWLNAFFIWLFFRVLFFLEPRRQLNEIQKREVHISSNVWSFSQFFIPKMH